MYREQLSSRHVPEKLKVCSKVSNAGDELKSYIFNGLFRNKTIELKN